jgi:hypothetical protein
VAELEQLTLDPLVSPAVVLGGEALDQGGDLGADRRPARAVRVGPLLSDQAAVPPQDGARGDQPVRPRPCGQEPDQRGQHRSVGPVQPGPGAGAAQHGDLVPQHTAAPRSWTPASGRPGQASHRAGRRSDRAGEGTRLIIMPHGHASPVAPGHRNRPTFGTRQGHLAGSLVTRSYSPGGVRRCCGVPLGLFAVLHERRFLPRAVWRRGAAAGALALGVSRCSHCLSATSRRAPVGRGRRHSGDIGLGVGWRATGEGRLWGCIG